MNQKGTGERTYPVAKIIDPELARLLPHGRHSIIPAGTHDMCTEQPAACTAAIRAFLARR
jgi:pimeloyl-ACP methyl ester carboxylesterase